MRAMTFLLLLATLVPLTLPALAQDGEGEDPPKQEPAPPGPDDKLLQAGIDKFGEANRAKDADARRALFREAIACWTRLTKEHPDSGSWGMAQFNIGFVTLNQLEQPKEAIAALKTLIEHPKVDDKDETGNLMDPYRNYRFHAWSLIVKAREQLKQPGLAVLACYERRKAYVTHCGTCYEGMMRGHRKRVKQVVRGWLLEREGKKVADDEAAALDALVDKAIEDEPDHFLLRLGQLYAARQQSFEARTALELLVKTFPKSERVGAARGLLAELPAE